MVLGKDGHVQHGIRWPLLGVLVVVPALVLGGCGGSDGPPLVGISQISAGGSHTCAVLEDGTARCWGANDFGQVGDGTHEGRKSPVPVLEERGGSPVVGVIEMSAGSFFTCAVLEDGTARCWGLNFSGQLGNGSNVDSSTPVAPLNAQGESLLSDVAQISANGSLACAMLEDGTARCWGDGIEGTPWEDPSGLTPTSTPVAVSLSGIDQIIAGPDSVCARLEDTTARCWGDRSLGNDTTERSPTPVDVLEEPGGSPLAGITQISIGGWHACAVLEDATARCWGDNLWGQIGDGTRFERPTPVAVLEAPGGSPLAEITQISAGGSHTCAVLEDGTARCWGGNDWGELGDGTGGHHDHEFRAAPAAVLEAPGGSPLAEITQISAGSSHTCAVLEDGTARCWGSNTSGELGNGRSILEFFKDFTTPVVVRE